MGAETIILGDWGTSNLRLLLLEEGEVSARAEGPGIGLATDRPEHIFKELTKNWPKVPALLCGMVGSSIGWVETDYIPTPAGLDDLSAGLKHFDANGQRICIIPGLSTTNALGAPDFMRGEETQLLGALREDPTLHQGRHLLCLPGTHTKWLVLEDGVVQRFQTALTGEIYAIILKHSVLAGCAMPGCDVDATAFDKAVARVQAQEGAGFLHQVFETRAQQLSGALERDHAASFLSGLFIGEDVRGALASIAKDFDKNQPVQVIGAPVMGRCYCEALKAFGVKAQWRDGAQLSLSGLRHFAEHLS